MRSVELAQSLPGDALAAVREFVAQHGPLTLSLMRRAVRDSGILADLERRPGQYQVVAQRWGVSERHARGVEEAARRISRIE